MRPHSLAFVLSAVLLLAHAVSDLSGQTTGQETKPFVTRDGDRLLEGDREFRFLSFNIPNLHYVEDDLRFDQSMPFRFPDAFEIEDALTTIDQVGGRVVRMYALSVRRADDPADMPRHIVGPGQLNEQALVVLDQVIAAAGRHDVRLIIPFVDQWSWWGGTAELAGFHGKQPEQFWTDADVKRDYQQIVTQVVQRVNSVNGARYCDDPTILAWETGNELKATDEWTQQMAAHIKRLDSRHLVIDGAMRPTVSQASLDDPNIDWVQTHHYDKDPRDMIDGITRNARLTRGIKPYHVGEFGFLSTAAMSAVMDTVCREHVSGALIWSLRYRSRDGGFYWHHEPAGGDRFKAYHWPGFAIGESFDERGLMRIVRQKAWEIRGQAVPAAAPPAAPTLRSVSAGAQLTWQGSVGAVAYDVQRADMPEGPWQTVRHDVCEAQVQYRPPFVDESVRPGTAYCYRVLARNPAGVSAASNVVGPVQITHRTLVDELWNDARWFLKEGKVRFVENEARKFKEDCHRAAGEAGSAIVYYVPGPVQSVRTFAFGPTDQPGVRLSGSADGRQFTPFEAQVDRSATHGEAAYGFWNAAVYLAQPERSQRAVRQARIPERIPGSAGRGRV